MYENVEETLATILAVVEKCPEQFKQKCFEILLEGYVDSQIQVLMPKQEIPNQQNNKPPVVIESNQNSLVPPSILQRLQITAKRFDLPLNKLESLFDFTKDPFSYHAIAIPGDNKADKSRKVVLVIAFKSYLSNGVWVADWKEVQAMTVDQNCYDRKNHGTFLKSNGNLFKDVEAGKNIELTSDGIKEAEKLIALLVKGDTK